MSLAPPSPSPLVPGYRLDRYELLCPIADGGMAQVWMARLRGKHGFEKLVAIKSILPKFAADPQFQSMFLDEARIASGIEHANVAQIFDLGEEHGVLYLAMEWVDGDALTKLHRVLDKKGERIPMGVLLRVVADVCGGLHAAHELRGKGGAPLGVVHRDVSPQNILVSTRGVAKLIDFGIAKARDRTSGDTGTGTLKGKVHYMAPEQALGSPIDRRADIWAIGSILYHYLSGKPPFEGPNQIATLHQLTLGKPPAPLPPEVPPAVSAIVLRALNHDCDKRFATAAEVRRALEAAMASSNLVTSLEDVAACLEKHLADRATRRREAVDIALAAAADRERVQELLLPDDGSVPSSALRPSTRARIEREARRTVPARGLSPGDKLPPPPSVPTAATLGLESNISGPPTSGRRNVVIAGVGVVGVALGVVLTIVLRSGGGGDSHASVAAAAAASTAPAPSVAPAAPAPSVTAPMAESSAQSPAPIASTATPAAAPARPAPAVRPPTGPARPTRQGKIPQVIDNGF